MNSKSQFESRLPLARILKIHEAIRTQRLPEEAYIRDDMPPHEKWRVNARYLALALETSKRTIMRDIDYMRDQLGMPILYDERKYCFYYEEQVGSFPLLQIAEGELFALLVAQKAIAQYRGTPFEQPLESVLYKITQSLPNRLTYRIEDLEAMTSFRISSVSQPEIEIFRSVQDALLEQKELHFYYQSPKRDKSSLKKVHPYHMANIEGSWYLFALLLDESEIRTFKLSRITAVEELPNEKLFEYPADFSIDEFLKNNAGVWGSKKLHKVKVKFDAIAAPHIKERRWNQSQEIRDLASGEIELLITVSNLLEFKGWILNWGEHATVMEPESFRKDIADTICSMRKLYK